MVARGAAAWGALLVACAIGSALGAEDCGLCGSQDEVWCPSRPAPYGPGDGSCQDASDYCAYSVVGNATECPSDVDPSRFTNGHACCVDDLDFKWCVSVYNKDSDTDGYCSRREDECQLHFETRSCAAIDISDALGHIMLIVVLTMVIAVLAVVTCVVLCVRSRNRRRAALVAVYQPLPAPQPYQQPVPPGQYGQQQQQQQQPPLQYSPYYAAQQQPPQQYQQAAGPMVSPVVSAVPSAPVE